MAARGYCQTCAEVGLRQVAHGVATVPAGRINGTPDKAATVPLCYDCTDALGADVIEHWGCDCGDPWCEDTREGAAWFIPEPPTDGETVAKTPISAETA